MLIETLKNFVDELEKEKSNFYAMYVCLACKIFFFEYRQYLCSSDITLKTMFDITIITLCHEFFLNITREQLKEYFDRNIDEDFTDFQRFVDQEIFTNGIQGGKFLSLYASYKDYILHERRSYVNLFTEIGIFSFSIFRVNSLSNEADFGVMDNVLTGLNMISTFLYTLRSIDSSGVDKRFIKTSENSISMSVYEYIENIHIINETGKSEDEYRSISNLTKNFLETSVDQDYLISDQLSKKYMDNVNVIIFIYSTLSFFIKQNRAMNLYLSSQYMDNLKNLRYAIIAYNQYRTKGGIYRTMMKEYVSKKIFTLLPGCIFKGKAISVSFSDNLIIDKIDFSFFGGDWISVQGDSGCGKTTFLNLLLGKNKDFEGELTFCGLKYNYFNIFEHISSVTPSGNLFKISVEENCLYGIKDVTKIHRDKMIYYLSLFGMGDVSLSLNIDSCSTGQKQRIKIVRLILHDRPIWFIDEITSNIDNSMAKIIMDELRKIGKDKLVISISHNPNMIIESDKKIYMTGSKIVNL